MKKFVLFFILLIAVTGLYAGDKYLSLHGNLPMTWESQTQSGITAKTHVLSTGFGLGFFQQYGEKWGLGTGFDLFFPQKLTTEIVGMGKSSVGRDMFDSLFGFMFYVGPGFTPVKTDKFMLALVPNFNYMLMSMSTSSQNTLTWMFGLGVGSEFGVKLSELIYLKLGLDFLYDFYSISFIAVPGETASSSGFLSDFSIVPKIGIGFNF